MPGVELLVGGQRLEELEGCNAFADEVLRFFRPEALGQLGVRQAVPVADHPAGSARCTVARRARVERDDSTAGARKRQRRGESRVARADDRDVARGGQRQLGRRLARRRIPPEGVPEDGAGLVGRHATPPSHSGPSAVGRASRSAALHARSRGAIICAMPDIVVIGGGITGTAAADALAREGHAVTLIEARRIAAMASGWTLGGVRQSGRDPAELPLARAAVAIWAGCTTRWASTSSIAAKAICGSGALRRRSR
jgi:hypothetical protein